MHEHVSTCAARLRKRVGSARSDGYPAPTPTPSEPLATDEMDVREDGLYDRPRSPLSHLTGQLHGQQPALKGDSGPQEQTARARPDRGVPRGSASTELHRLARRGRTITNPSHLVLMPVLRADQAGLEWSSHYRLRHGVEHRFPRLTRSHDNQRHGATSVFGARNLRSGGIVRSLHRPHRTEEFKPCLDQFDAAVPANLTGHRVLDHKAPLIQRRLVRHPPFAQQFAPCADRCS